MEITLKNLQKKILLPKLRIIKSAKAAFRKLDFVLDDLSIVFVGAKRMRSVNREYLKHDYVTDVLTFDLGEGMGEIIICPEVAVANAKVHRTTIDHEIILYVIHGILHLAGYDDHTAQDILQMRRMEKELL